MNIHKLSLKTKLIGSFLLVSIVPILLLGVFLNHQLERYLLQAETESANQVLVQLEGRIGIYLSQFTKTAGAIANVPNVQKLIGTAKLSPQEAEALNLQAATEIKQISSSSSDIALVTLYGANGARIASDSFQEVPVWDEVMQSAIGEKLKSGQNRPFFIGPYQLKRAEPAYSYIWPIVRLDGSGIDGMIVIDIKVEQLIAMLGEIKLGQTGRVQILSGETIALDQNTDQIAKPYDKKELMPMLSQEPVAKAFINHNILISSVGLEGTPWVMVGEVQTDELIAVLAEMRMIFLAVAIGLVLLIVWFSISITRGITKPISHFTSLMESLGQGDFTKKSAGRLSGEMAVLAVSYNRMVEQMRDLVGETQVLVSSVTEQTDLLDSHAQETAYASEEVARSVQQIATGASRQAMECEVCADQANLLQAKVDDVYTKTEALEMSARHAAGLTSEGLGKMHLLKTKAQENTQIAEESDQILRRLSKKAEEINSINGTIAKITKQTNLLALNASIEAARAGEAGKGFGVVAGEVRQLAEESSRAAMEIDQIIQSIRHEVKEAAEHTQLTKGVVSAQNQLVHEAEQIFEQITRDMAQIVADNGHVTQEVVVMKQSAEMFLMMIQNISAVSQEAAAGAEEVNATAEEQTAVVAQVATALEALKHQAEILKEAIRVFKIH
ncbi:methyl-accepting chemotaxis protein [Brevibacillus dissolubilis]|uniref:methyl-accepting chemotaxis protein n=1 Tax=Brevibacillus dissolubilis TaxID=1844116 RepID=UPI0011175065|nr:methyl-accepting chemotaxis protein [Brevibacillus dissolubilis]